MPVPDEPTPPGGTRTGSRAAARERTHAGLLDAAAAVFAEKGYGAASVGEIARTAGVSVGSIYAHFAGKQDLFLALMDRRRVAEMDDARRHLADGLPSALHDLDHRVTATADDGRAALLAAEAWLYAMRDPDFGADLAAHQDRLRADLLPLIRAERARRGAAWSLTDEEVATVALGLFSGLVQHRRLARDSVPADLYGRALLALLHGLATRD